MRCDTDTDTDTDTRIGDGGTEAAVKTAEASRGDDM